MAGNNIHINVDENRVIVQEDQTQIVQVVAQGPQGRVGPQGPAGPSGSATSVGDSGSLQFAWDGETISGSGDLVFEPLLRTLTLSGSFLISGSILPDADPATGVSTFSLGSATNAWKDLYVGDSTIYFVSESITHPLTIITTEEGIVTLSIDGHPVATTDTTGSQNITASLADTASFALTASYALNSFTNLITTGSITASVDISSDIFLIKSASVDMFKVNNEGVTILKTNTSTPTAIAGGIFYSGSGDFFFGS